MIRLIDVTIENFRSIIEKPLEIDFSNYTVIVGENNSGKSNILRALNLFFNDKVDNDKYNPQIDYPQDVNLSRQARTKVIVTLQYDPLKEKK
ncbi:AAA family ATPase [Breznakiella homolactica]|uniref:AAA family ATPase n=1 Tax=Breznakiella homolactica TaxID=2798577 RepID=A0A7T7XQ74_9SPIR|nr:AAA family ATPase [Breznakiella homolactica]QQO10378.1 AAA family ATPase [Breznakiella homolactica]